MKSIISEISDSFYTKIIDNDYFSAFFIDKDFDHIKQHVTDYIHYTLTSEKEDLDDSKSYYIGTQHSKMGVPLNIVLNFTDTIQQEVFQYSKKEPEAFKNLRPENIEYMKNAISKGYLHESIKNADLMSIPPLFSVLSTTKIAMAVVSWMVDMHEVLLNESDDSNLISLDRSCRLLEFINKPSFNMIFDSEDNFF